MNSPNDLSRAKAHWETTSRLLATLINEGLVKFDTTLREPDNSLHVRISPRDDSEGYDQRCIFVRARREPGYDALKAKLSCPLSPEELQLPLVWNTTGDPVSNQLANSDPETLFEAIFPWLGYESACKAQIIKELRSSARFQGPFEKILDSLIKENGIDVTKALEDRMIIPCFSRQLPAVFQHLGPSVAMYSSAVLHGRAQASLRTISLSTSGLFQYDLKLALACNISSALRTITPWTALIGPEVSSILDNVLPSDMWVCHEIAAATGSDTNFDKAKHCSVLIRENLEAKARARGETLIVSAALAERGVDSEVCHAERVFGLQSEPQKEIWFRNLEGHSQNILARFHVESQKLVGFVYRDFGGLKLHTPTLAQQGYEVKSSPPGSLILTDNMVELWENCHHTIFQSHLNQLVEALRLRKSRAWAIVRQELLKELDPDRNAQAKQLYEFLTQTMVPYKCFLRMKMQGLYRDVRVVAVWQGDVR
ncbi:MAG: hypothetical protein Q9195_008553 [Heterodermia aff. obscurata]